MEILRLSLAEGAEAARGLAVIIDVFRAFSCEPLLYYLGAKRIVLEGDPEACLAFKQHDPEAVLVGEVNEVPIDGFDLTNSPSLILAAGPAQFAGRTIVHRTTSGVTGAITALPRCNEVLLGSFMTARATAALIQKRQPQVVSLVAMGIRSRAKAPEDEACGDYLESLLGGRPFDPLGALEAILAHETTAKFLRNDKAYLPPADPLLCLQRDLFDFALRAERRGELIESVRCDP
ncbi:MAG: 2-phosphosulfolactate phosphatase [Rhodospirillales bacterium]|nr:2-phosphosulfolactate phosphatase [Rhodospirillales bacterium]